MLVVMPQHGCVPVSCVEQTSLFSTQGMTGAVHAESTFVAGECTRSTFVAGAYTRSTFVAGECTSRTQWPCMRGYERHQHRASVRRNCTVSTVKGPSHVVQGSGPAAGDSRRQLA